MNREGKPVLKGRMENSLITCVVIVLAAGLCVFATFGAVAAGVAVALSGLIAMATVLGGYRSALVLMGLAFGFAPMYRGFQSLSAGFATPPDILAVLAILLLLPTLARKPVSLPPVFTVGIGVVLLFGLVATAVADVPVNHLFSLAQWVFYLGVLPAFMAWWRPEVKIIVALLWCYLVGQTASTAYGLVHGPVDDGRYQGLSHHPNAFGLAAMMACGMVLFLFDYYRTTGMRLLVLAAGGVGVVSLSMSGSRSALVVVAVLILLVPIVERSTVWGVVTAIVGALAIAALPLVVGSSGTGSAISRLAGNDSTVQGADNARSSALADGLHQLAASPLWGSGLTNVELIHNTFVEAAVGIGIFGALGYLAVLFTLVRPLISSLTTRRLCYLACAVVGIGPALPSLWDRTVWVPVSVVGVVMAEYFAASRSVAREVSETPVGA